MGGYLFVGRRNDNDDILGRHLALKDRARSQGMTVSDLGPYAWVASQGPRPLNRTDFGAWHLFGDTFHRRDPQLPQTASSDLHAFERKLVARVWGRYVGFRSGPGGWIDAVLRDPSGALDCVLWNHPDLDIVSSLPPDWLLQALNPNWTVDFGRVAQVLKRPQLAWDELLLKGPRSVLPGSVHPLPDGPSEILWRPATFARSDRFRGATTAQTSEALRSAVDEAVGALAGACPTIAAEVSGGLDSSIVAASLKRAGGASLWLNAYGPDREGDERGYVTRLASHLDIHPDYVPRATGPLTEADLWRISVGFRPGFNAMDVPNEDLWAGAWTEAGVTAVMTGKGGDAVFVQNASEDVFADLWSTGRTRALLSAGLVQLARWNERSVWSLLRHARHTRRTMRRAPRLTIKATPDDDHPWLRDTSDLPPSKRYQIAGVINGLTFQSPSPQTRVVDLFHPLLAQPVVETCLALTTPQLTLMTRDRALARLAFRDRLPVEIADRRSKGEMTAYYGRRLAAGLSVLRPWLLDGRLMAEGLLDRVALDASLQPESLIWHGGYSDIMTAATLEGWVRAWQDQLGAAR